jgi:hypothetical protein
VNADGSIAAGDGFTVVKFATGQYTVTLAPGFRYVSATVTSTTTNQIAALATPTERSFGVNFYTTAAALVDTAFTFTAVGTQQ